MLGVEVKLYPFLFGGNGLEGVKQKKNFITNFYNKSYGHKK